MSLVLDVTIKMSAILLMALAARALLWQSSASARHWLVSIALGCAAALPLLALIAPAWQIGGQPFSPAVGAAQTESTVSAASIVVQTPIATDAVPIQTKREPAAAIGSV